MAPQRKFWSCSWTVNAYPDISDDAGLKVRCGSDHVQAPGGMRNVGLPQQLTPARNPPAAHLAIADAPRPTGKNKKKRCTSVRDTRRSGRGQCVAAILGGRPMILVRQERHVVEAFASDGRVKAERGTLMPFVQEDPHPRQDEECSSAARRGKGPLRSANFGRFQ
jgi:hypothetical protein